MEIKDIQTFNDDCIERMTQMIADDIKVDAIICDIPYGIHNNKFDTLIPVSDMWKCINALLKPKGNIVLFGVGMSAARLMMSNEKQFRYELIWKKSKCGSPLSAKYMPLKKHEVIMVFGEPASYYEPQMSVGEPYKRKYTPNKKNNLKYGIKGVETNNTGTRHPSTILDFPQKWRRQDQVHPTQKPVELMEFLVKSYCPIGGTVLDFCAGSGSTGVACVNTSRKFIGIEIDEHYYDVMNERLNDAITSKK